MSKVTEVNEWTGQVLNPELSGGLSCLMGKICQILNVVLALQTQMEPLLGHLLRVSPAYLLGVLRTAQFWVPGSATLEASWPVREGSRYILPGKVMRSQASSALKRPDASAPVCLSKAVFTVASSEPKGTCFHLPVRTALSVSAW